ncbi:MAG: hypothetical protein V1731_01155 [Candidatus Aenigmatarchaeota archaeon]
MVLEKPAGVILILAGIFFVVFFPDVTQSAVYQPAEFAYVGILVGLFLMAAGIKLLFG